MIDELLRKPMIDSQNEYLDYAVHIAIDWIDNFIFDNLKDDFCLV